MAGAVVALDGTPQKAIVVEALRYDAGQWEAVAQTLTNTLGKYRFVNLRPGRYRVRAHVPGAHVYYAAGEHEQAALDMGSDALYEDIDIDIIPFRKGVWRIYNHLDGLADNSVSSVLQDRDGLMWFGTF